LSKLKCSECQALVVDYIKDQIDSVAKQNISRHINECEQCHSYCRFMQVYLQSIADIEAPTAPAGFLNKVHGRLEKQRSILVQYFLLSKQFILKGAGVLTLVLCLILLLNNQQRLSSLEKQSPQPLETITDLNQDASEQAVESAPNVSLSPTAESSKPKTVPKPALTIDTNKVQNELTYRLVVGTEAVANNALESQAKHPLPLINRRIKQPEPEAEIMEESLSGESEVAAGRLQFLSNSIAKQVTVFKGEILGQNDHDVNIVRIRIKIPKVNLNSFLTELKTLGELQGELIDQGSIDNASDYQVLNLELQINRT